MADLYAGAAFLVLGSISGIVDLSLADAKLVGEAAGDCAGSSVASGDLDGDGADDALVGAPPQHAGGTDAGAAYLVLGVLSGRADLSVSDAKLLGGGVGDYAGTSVAAGDFDGDGAEDVVVGAPGDDAGGTAAGAAYLVLGGGL